MLVTTTLLSSVQLHVQLQMFVQIHSRLCSFREHEAAGKDLGCRVSCNKYHAGYYVLPPNTARCPKVPHMSHLLCRIPCSSTQHCKIQSTARELLAAHTHHRCSRISQLHEQDLHLQGLQEAAFCPPAEPAKWPHQPLHSPQCQSKPVKHEHSAYKAPMPLLLHTSAFRQQMDCKCLASSKHFGRDAKFNKKTD